mmetsp:Transcript_112432/g.350390  ORF Transcript_112432/g.350390 Transcript_112432/m.350390 type:complete len:288 (+) Transcript_112432:44-907(+)
MNGYTVNGATIVVKLADNQGQNGAQVLGGSRAVGGGGGGPIAPMQALADGGEPPMQGERIYIKGLPPGMTDDAVHQIFAAYGTVNDSKVLVANGKSSDGQGQSVAIVRMGTVTEAAWLVENVHGNIPQGLVSPVEITFASSSRSPQAASNTRSSPYKGGCAPVQAGSYGTVPALPPPVMPQVHGGGKGGPGSDSLVPNMRLMMQQSGPNATLYIKGLPMGADDLYLYKAFAPFGCVLSAKAIAKDSYVIGFVHYASEDQAQGAIASLNGLTLNDGATLQVAVKTAKA